MKQIFKFQSDWCQPCKVLAKIIETDIKPNVQDVEFITIDVEDGSGRSESFGIKSIPTMILLKDDIEVDRMVGVNSKEKILEFINQ